jgi:putative ABC transport system substrate-binding protein
MRWAEGRRDRLPALAAELVQLDVDVIVTAQTTPALAVRRATAVIPIVVAAAADPVDAGLVDSLARPGGNITGLTLIAPELDGKRLELLKELNPTVSRIGLLLVAQDAAMRLRRQESALAAAGLGLSLHVEEVQYPYDFQRAFTAMKKDGVEALIVPALFTANQGDRKAIVGLAYRHRIPTLYDSKEFVDAGGLMAFGPSIASSWYRAATYVDKILKGAKPAELPIEQPSKFELVINLQTARAIGLTVPPSLLVRASRIVE